MIRRFARPYARAIMDVAATPEGAEQVLADLRRFEAVQGSSPELRETLASPGVGFEAKLGIMRALAAKLELSELAVRILEVLIRNHRIARIGAINEALRAAINEAVGRTTAQVRAAHDLSSEERQGLQDVLEKRFGRGVDLEVSTDRSLLGGFVAKLESEVWDASVLGQISQLRESLS